MDATRALITGASSGIGEAIAREYAAAGTHVVLVARREERLRALADELTSMHGVDVEVLVADLITDDGRRRTEERLASGDAPIIDVLVNNAGLVIDEPIADSDPDDRIREVELNVVAVTRLATVAAGLFRDRGRGGILNVASVTAFLPVPKNATYAAGKAYVLSFSEALHVEMLGTGVHVSAVCPGFTKTEIFEQGDVDVSGVPSPLWLTAEEVARAAIKGVAKNDAVVTPGSAWQAMRFASRLTPPPIGRQLSEWMGKLARG